MVALYIEQFILLRSCFHRMKKRMNWYKQYFYIHKILFGNLITFLKRDKNSSFNAKHILQIIMWTESLQCALQLLGLLYKLNVTAGIRVPYETFHLSELSEYVDISRDYFKWLTEDDRSYVSYHKFSKAAYCYTQHYNSHNFSVP